MAKAPNPDLAAALELCVVAMAIRFDAARENLYYNVLSQIRSMRRSSGTTDTDAIREARLRPPD